MSSETKNTDTRLAVFKRPPSPSRLPSLQGQVKKRKLKVLDEDEYVEKVSKIIGKDYFPELEKLEARSEYIDASSRNDLAAMSRIRERFSSSSAVQHQQRPDSPDTFETPLEDRREEPEIPESGNPSRKGKKDFSDTESVSSLAQGEKKNEVSLDQFMAKYTSEDNSSFEEIMENAEKKYRLTHSWMFKDEEIKSIEMKKKELEVPAIENQVHDKREDDGKTKAIEGWTYKNKNYVFYNPDGVPLTPEEEIERAKKQRVIVKENTRFQKNPWKSEVQNTFLKENVISKQVKEAGKIGVDGKEIIKPGTPSVNGFKFLRMTPSPMPDAGSESPMMTWGEVESTPFRLEGCETPLPINTSGGPSFSIQDVPKRDRIAYELAEKNSKFYRDKKGKAIQKARSNIKTPNANLSQRVASMSPAAQRLATNKLGIRLGTDKGLSITNTPTPRSSFRDTPSRKSVISSSIRSKSGSTPIPKYMQSPRTPASSSLTDNLLSLPSSSTQQPSSRPKAADYL